MYYDEQWIDGKLCWRTSPDGAWTAYTANELAHRYQAELTRASDAQRALDAERHSKQCDMETLTLKFTSQLATLQALVRALIYSDNAPEHDRAWFALRATLDATPTATPTHNGGA